MAPIGVPVSVERIQADSPLHRRLILQSLTRLQLPQRSPGQLHIIRRQELPCTFRDADGVRRGVRAAP